MPRRGRQRSPSRGGLEIAALAIWLFASVPGFSREPARFQDVPVRPGDTLWGIAQKYLKDPKSWDRILRYNTLPSSDPTAALPGMVLKVPVFLIKEEMRAARFLFLVNKVDLRQRETADWKAAAVSIQLYRGDAVRTMIASRADVGFLDGGVIHIGPQSLAILKPPSRPQDINLNRGSALARRAMIVTPSARITPKTRDTQYLARIRQDLSTVVKVYAGVAAVSSAGKTVDVKAGMQTTAPLGLAPGPARRIRDMDGFRAEIADYGGDAGAGGRAKIAIAPGAAVAQARPEEIKASADGEDLAADIRAMSVGLPLSAYRVQASLDRNFSAIVFNHVYDPDYRFSPAESGLDAGIYWWRIALIDLLGAQQKFSTPRLYSIGAARDSADEGEVDIHRAWRLIRPSKDETVSTDKYLVQGIVKSPSIDVMVNDVPAHIGEHGDFAAEIQLHPGVNDVVVSVRNAAGDTDTASRRISRF